MEKLILNRLKGGEYIGFSFFYFCFYNFYLYINFFKNKNRNNQFTSMSEKHLNEDYKIIIKLRIFNKFTIIKIILTDKKLKRLNLQQEAKIIKTRIIENKSKIDKKIFKVMKKIKINIKKINLSINIGTENASLTALLVAIISSITGIVFRKSIINKNLINIAVSGIFEIKMIHIINIMYVLNKKKGVKKNERTSNRRTYDYSYE